MGAPGVPSVGAGAATKNTAKGKSKMDQVGLRIFAIEYKTLKRTLFTHSGGIDIMKYGPRGDRTFGDEKEKSKEGSWQQRIVMDEGSLSELEEAEERYFAV